MKMMTNQKKETDERFPALESAVKQLQTRASSTDVNLGNLQAQVNNRLPSQPVANPRDNKTQGFDPHEEKHSNANDQQRSCAPRAPFPQCLRKEKSDDVNAEILETFRKISLGENVSVIFQKKLPPKCKDPGIFLIPCKIEDLKLDRAMLDLGASINVMPRSIYDRVQLGLLKETGLIIQLADRSNAYPDGVLEDVLVQVNELVFPADFYVLDMGPNDNSIDVPLLLGRPFLKTARTKINVHKGNLTMEFDGEDDELKSVLAKSIFDVDEHEFIISDSLINSVCALDSPKLTCFKPILPSLTVTDKQVPSLISPPKLELKELLKNLKYIFLGANQTLPLVVPNALTEIQESKLLRVLRKHREAFGWTLANIRGLSMTLCSHKIALEPNSVPKRDP
ncbi:uncharacterized protein LOC105766989 [Gossypium raimondii]|uniref:uncharacterized protein LOC105766989 n=1 Tax=Gossypium raimondii TaxID=29730 RepID=UPI00227D6F5A|nr:uncharacterized protein LOC105766989 [Gossypium raimondii]